MRFIHTADWQIGKPFAGISDAHKRSLVQQARIEAVKRIGEDTREAAADLVLVAGDLFDSSNADKATVSAACSAIGEIGLPVVVIPGNHDHGGPGSVWSQDFFLREREALASNMVVLLESVPHELETAVILPCPLLRRAPVGDPTAWLRSSSVYAQLPAHKPRIVLAHGSTQDFCGEWDDEVEESSITSVIELERLPDPEIDYIALGDWHGAKQVGAKAWYAGTPEPDRFPKGGGHDAGKVLVVDAERGGMPRVVSEPTGRLTWTGLSFDLTGDVALDELQDRLASLLGQRAGEDLLRLSLTGAVGIEASNRLKLLLESLDARLLRLELIDRTVMAPTEAEIEALAGRVGDPLIARVAAKLVEQAEGQDEDAAVARIALRELHATCDRGEAS